MASYKKIVLGTCFLPTFNFKVPLSEVALVDSDLAFWHFHNASWNQLETGLHWSLFPFFGTFVGPFVGNMQCGVT